MKPLRIGILTPTFLPKCSGAEIFHHNLAVRLAAAGHHPAVLAPASRVRALRACGWDLPYAVEVFPEKAWHLMKRHAGMGLWLSRLAMGRLQRKHRFDVWHAVVLYPAGVAFADWQSHSRVPGLIRAVGDDVGGIPGRVHEDWKQQLLRTKLPLVQGMVALSADMAGELAGLGVDRDRIRIIPNAVESSRFEGPRPDRAEVLRGLGVPPDSFVFLCVARNHPQKDFPTLFAALRELLDRATGRDVRLVVAGREASGLAAAAEAAGVADRVHLVELGAGSGGNEPPLLPPPRLVGLYRTADAFVIASLLEGFSSAILEAMAAGLPLVVTDVPGIRGVVGPDREGLVVPCGDPRALASAMERLSGDGELRRRLSDGGRVTSRQYSWATVTSSYLELYGELIGRQERA